MIFFIPWQQTKIVFIRKKTGSMHLKSKPQTYSANQYNLKQVHFPRLSDVQEVSGFV